MFHKLRTKGSCTLVRPTKELASGQYALRQIAIQATACSPWAGNCGRCLVLIADLERLPAAGK